jgi:hypothetical protein
VDVALDVVVMELDAQRAVPAGDVARGSHRKPTFVSIHEPSPRGGRLDDQHWIASRDEWNDGLAPAAVVREFDHLGAQPIARVSIFR